MATEEEKKRLQDAYNAAEAAYRRNPNDETYAAAQAAGEELAKAYGAIGFYQRKIH